MIAALIVQEDGQPVSIIFPGAAEFIEREFLTR